MASWLNRVFGVDPVTPDRKQRRPNLPPIAGTVRRASADSAGAAPAPILASNGARVVDTVFWIVLGRGPSEQERRERAQALKSGQPFDHLLHALIASPEFRLIFGWYAGRSDRQARKPADVRAPRHADTRDIIETKRNFGPGSREGEVYLDRSAARATGYFPLVLNPDFAWFRDRVSPPSLTSEGRPERARQQTEHVRQREVAAAGRRRSAPRCRRTRSRPGRAGRSP